jgi:hypothetical protein
VTQTKRRRIIFSAILLGAPPLGRTFDSNGNLYITGQSPAKTGQRPNTFPLRVEVGKRYLVDANNRPFLIHGDAAWSLIVQLSRDQVDFYLDHRRKQGFNTILVNLIEHKFTTAPPKNYYGIEPFLTLGDFETPNEDYFLHADYVITKAAEMGILVMLAPAYMGFDGESEGWYHEIQANGAKKLQTFGRYLANRFRHHANIIWVHGGDFDPPEKTLLRALVSGIRDTDHRALNTFHGSRGTSATSYLGTTEPWLQLSTIYTGSTDVVGQAMQEYRRSTKPFFLIEARYEGEGANDATVRLQAYQAILSGGCGQIMGNLPVWRFGDGWQKALNSEGAHTLIYLYNLFDACAWPKLVPDFANTFFTSGINSAAEQAVAAVARDGSFALLYMPTARSVTINLAQLGGPKTKIHWYDPSNGRLSETSGSPFTTSGIHTFIPASNNASGHSDWVLIFKSTM